VCHQGVERWRKDETHSLDLQKEELSERLEKQPP
jgi:hypothetical protein